MDDLISRQAAIEAIELVDWYHQNSNKDMVHGANDNEHQAWYKADDVYKALEAVPPADRPIDEFDGMIFSTDKYMAFIDKKEIHILRKGACKVTMERMFNTEKGEYKPMPKHDRDWIVGCIKHDGFIKTDRGDKANQIILDALSAGRPRGEWIETAQDYYETVNKKGGGVNENTEYFTDDIACSECLTKFSNIDNETERFNFCPNCGAEMRGEDE